MISTSSRRVCRFVDFRRRVLRSRDQNAALGRYLGRNCANRCPATASCPGPQDRHALSRFNGRPEAVWSWIAQLGQLRAGFYSYDFLENLVGMDIQRRSHCARMAEDPRGRRRPSRRRVSLAVAVADAPHALVLRGGVPMGGAPSFDSHLGVCVA